MSDRCFYFGCWGTPGHYLFTPGVRSRDHDSRRIEYYATGLHLDGTLAPRRLREYYGGGICWTGQDQQQRSQLQSNSSECPQGQFLLHHLANGFTAISWWDRNQGDTRSACNSTILLEGEHTTAEMLAALALHFPHVLENLKKAGVELVEAAP